MSRGHSRSGDSARCGPPRGGDVGVALALGTRRGTLAAGISAFAALALAIGVVGRGCHVDEPGPDACVRDLLTAARAGDRKAIFDLLSPDTQRAIVDRAEGANALVRAG